MIPFWAAHVLTFSQAIYLVGALPKPQAHGLYGPDSGSPCADSGSDLPEVFVISSTSSANLLSARQTASGSSSSTDSNNSTYTSAITIIQPGRPVTVVTSTGLSSTQVPTTTSASQSLPDTTGSVQTTLETGGNPTSQPFATSIPSVSSSTLVPTNTSGQAPSSTSPTSTITQTITVPLTTFETTLVTSTVTSVPVESTVTITSNSSVITSTGTVLSQTTIVASTTSTGTIATTVTTNGSPTTIPTSAPTCTDDQGCSGLDIFLPVALGAPPASIPQQSGHPVPRLGITDNGTGPIETNKFYANIFLGTQGQSVFTEPYSLMWSQGSGNAMSYGMSVSHVEASQRVFGPANTEIPYSPNSYYINPIGIQSIILSAAEFRSSTILTSDGLLAFSANIHLLPEPGSSSSLTMPMVQGMAFVTGIYDELQAVLESSVFFRTVTSAGSPKPGMYKYVAILEDGRRWLIYAVPNSGIPPPNFQLTSSTMLQGIPAWSGLVQVAKNPISDDTLYDNAAGTYPTTGSISGYQTSANASYNMSWTKGGAFGYNTTLLMYALPHHLQSFDSLTSSAVNSSLQLDTTTKGTATAVVADSWTLVEELPVDMGFYPYRPGNGSVSTLSSSAITAIQSVSAAEASQNMSAQTDLNSMYYSGKALSKFAQITLVMHDLADQEDLANAALIQLIAAFARFVNNTQIFPLLYDMDWRGVVSSASYVTGDSGEDFGNSYYNDHHFHYGYFVSAAAVIGYLDPTWIPANKDWVNALVRDVSNPSSQDQYFPVFRSFDWYNGHSWAKGLFESGDGKDQESSSEDTMFSYGLKMWGRVIGDASMEARGNLMLAVQARSLQNYFLLEASNTNQPAQFIGNKVTGIMFQNKVDHTTYFGSNFEYIQGIHMIPIMPFSTLTRTQQFVAEEWVTYFVDGACDPASNVTGGWRGILYSNLAIIDPQTAYEFFTQPNFDPSWLDGGASQTWYIALSAALGGG